MPYPGDPDDPDSRQGSAPPKKSLWDVFRRPWRSLRDHFFADQEPNGWEELVCIDYGDDEVNNLLLEERLRKQKRWAAEPSKREPKCQNCTVHAGFLKSWLSTRDAILPHILKSHIDYPDYSIHH